MGIGPLLMFDKSFLQSLNADELAELDMEFTIIANPMLELEILGDLLHPEEKMLDGKIMQSLARKMSRGYVTPINFRKAAIANLHGFKIAMTGQTVIDTSEPHISTTPDGKGIWIDSTVDQEIWSAWAQGHFGQEEHDFAARWRDNIAAIDLDLFISNWTAFTDEFTHDAKTISDVKQIVDRDIIDTFDRKTQKKFLWLTLQFLETTQEQGGLPLTLFDANLMPRVRDYAPYATMVGRISLVFLASLARGLIGKRVTNFIDMQYLFYSPFCTVFASSDKFQRDLWVVAEVSRFVWGPELKGELSARAQARSRSEKVNPWDSPLISRLRRECMKFRT